MVIIGPRQCHSLLFLRVNTLAIMIRHAEGSDHDENVWRPVKLRCRGQNHKNSIVAIDVDVPESQIAGTHRVRIGTFRLWNDVGPRTDRSGPRWENRTFYPLRTRSNWFLTRTRILTARPELPEPKHWQNPGIDRTRCTRCSFASNFCLPNGEAATKSTCSSANSDASRLELNRALTFAIIDSVDPENAHNKDIAD